MVAVAAVLNPYSLTTKLYIAVRDQVWMCISATFGLTIAFGHFRRNLPLNLWTELDLHVATGIDRPLRWAQNAR